MRGGAGGEQQDPVDRDGPQRVPGQFGVGEVGGVDGDLRDREVGLGVGDFAAAQVEASALALAEADVGEAGGAGGVGAALADRIGREREVAREGGAGERRGLRAGEQDGVEFSCGRLP